MRTQRKKGGIIPTGGWKYRNQIDTVACVCKVTQPSVEVYCGDKVHGRYFKTHTCRQACLDKCVWHVTASEIENRPDFAKEPMRFYGNKSTKNKGKVKRLD